MRPYAGSSSSARIGEGIVEKDLLWLPVGLCLVSCCTFHPFLQWVYCNLVGEVCRGSVANSQRPSLTIEVSEDLRVG